MRGARLIAALAMLLGLAAGCQRGPSPPAATPVGSMTADLKAQGDALARQGQHAQAAVKYLAALNQEPGSIPIRFALAVALSNLEGRRQETAEHFKVVMAQGTPGSDEVRLARQWLTAAGELEGSAPRSEATASPQESEPDKGRVRGRIQWQAIDPRNERIEIAVGLEGEDNSNKFRRPDFKIGRVYEFRNVPPGAYRLIAENSGTRMWEHRVTVEAGKETVLDLTESNAAVSPKDFKPRSE
jgi:hypothetical protein